MFKKLRELRFPAPLRFGAVFAVKTPSTFVSFV
jgi:hypothetical protein